MVPQNRRWPIVATLVAGMFCGGANAAIVFDFNWTSAGSTPDPSGASASATGSFTVEKQASEAFTRADVSALNITVISDDLGSESYGLTNIRFLSGTIANDGLSASFDVVALLSSGLSDFSFFGCNPISDSTSDCSRILFGINIETNNQVFETYLYSSAEAGRSSFQATATASPVPVPGTLALLGLGLAGLGFMRRRRT